MAELMSGEGATDKHSPIASARSEASRSGSDAGHADVTFETVRA